MDEILDTPVQLSNRLDLKQLMTKEGGEFQIDLDFKGEKGRSWDVRPDGNLLLDQDDEEEDSDIDDALSNIESSMEKLLLSTADYKSFEDLATKMTDCISSGEVKMLILEEGDGPLVPYDAEVSIHYAAYWENASIPFDSTLTMNRGAPLRIRLGSGKIIPGLEIGITMLKGPKARAMFLIQPKLAWGPMGVPPRILPLPALFVCSLLSIRDVTAGKRFNDLPSAEQKKFEVTARTVKSLYEQAKYYVSKRQYMRAIKNYQQSLSVLNICRPENELEEQEIKKFKINGYVNLAVCYYKVEKPKYVIGMLENLDNIIDINKHCKALFYYGRAYEMQGKTEDAITYYKKALNLEPRNKDIGKALAKIDTYIKLSAVNEKKMWQKAMKSVPVEKKEYNVDEDFKRTVTDMCQDLAGRQEYVKFDLPRGLLKDEIDYIKDLITQFEGVVLQEDGDGNKRKFSIIKRS